MERDDVVVLNDIIQARRIIVANFLHLLDLLATFLVAAVEVVNRPEVYCVINANQGLIKRFLDGTLDMRTHVRVTRETFNALEVMLAPQRHGYNMAFRLLVFLFWLACGTSYRVVAAVFDIPRSTVHCIVHTVLHKVLLLSDRIVTFPTREELPAVGEGFAGLARSEVFSNAVGALDGCHVKVKVCGPNKNDYFNRKLDFSVQFQAVVDCKGMFINVFAGYPGSVHDSRVLRASPLYRQSHYPPEGYFLLGDGGYPLLYQPVCLMTPYRNPAPADIDKVTFNIYHARGRSIVERSFGMMKARWRSVFMKALEIKHTKAARVIMACCVMHNICVSHGDVLQPLVVDDDDDVDYDEENIVFDEEIAAQLRDHLARRLNPRNALQR